MAKGGSLIFFTLPLSPQVNQSEGEYDRAPIFTD